MKLTIVVLSVALIFGKSNSEEVIYVLKFCIQNQSFQVNDIFDAILYNRSECRTFK